LRRSGYRTFEAGSCAEALWDRMARLARRSRSSGKPFTAKHLLETVEAVLAASPAPLRSGLGYGARVA
jgi:hypothetical protein